MESMALFKGFETEAYIILNKKKSLNNSAESVVSNE